MERSKRKDRTASYETNFKINISQFCKHVCFKGKWQSLKI